MFISNLRRLHLEKFYHNTTTTKRIENLKNLKIQSSYMHIDCYYSFSSAACRTVLLTAGALDVKLNLIHLDYMTNKYYLKPEALKINPQYTIPTIVDDGFYLWESRTISRYLVNKYGGESTLYPNDPKVRAIVDQRLDFDLGTLYQRYAQYCFFKGAPADEEAFNSMHKSLKLFNIFLEGKDYSAGSNLTIADFAFISTITNMEASGINFTKYPNITNWYERVKSISPYYNDFIQHGVEEVKKFINKYKVNKNSFL